MFYHGGMTLGYLTPPAKSEKRIAMADEKVRVEIAPRQRPQVSVESDPEREQELSRAFMTPWHLFY